MGIAEVNEKMRVVQGIMNDVQNMVDAAKEDFKAVIKDKSIPLKDRWELFSHAPAGFSEQDPWIWNPEALKPLGRSPWRDLIWAERHRVINLVDQLSDWIYEYGIIPEDGDAPYEGREEGDEDRLTPEIVLALVEEVLENNIVSFTYDW